MTAEIFFSNERDNATSRNPTAPIEAIFFPFPSDIPTPVGLSETGVFFIITNGFFCIVPDSSEISGLTKLLGISQIDVDVNRLAVEKSSALARMGTSLATVASAKVENSPDEPQKPDTDEPESSPDDTV